MSGWVLKGEAEKSSLFRRTVYEGAGQPEEPGPSQQFEPSSSLCVLNGNCLATPWVYAPVANCGRLVNPGQNHDESW